MEENRNTENVNVTYRDESHPMCANHPIMKNILIGLLIFLGAFCAFYVVADWHFKRMMNPISYQAGFKSDCMMKKEFKNLDKMFRSEKILSGKSANIIHMEQGDEDYKIIIDLRAFDNNENNLQVTTNGNILTINGRSIRKSKNNEQISEFQQNYMFGENVNLSDLTKETRGNYYVVSIPIENKSDND